MVDKSKIDGNEAEFNKIYKDSHIFDGITDFSIYNEITPKILWILKEPNDKNEASWDQRTFHKDVSVYPKWRKTYKLIIKVSYSIFNNINKYEEIPDEYKIRNILNNIAFINIKKKGGHSVANDKIIRNTYNRDKKLILEQIELLKPDIIINCSRVWNLFCDFIMPIKPKTSNNNIFHYCFIDNSIIINAYHPNNRKISGKQYFDNIMEYINMYKKDKWTNCI